METPNPNNPLILNPRCNPNCHACQYKGLDYSQQLLRKNEWARKQLVPWYSSLKPIVPAPQNELLEYRSKTWLRTGTGPDHRISFGIYRSVKKCEKWTEEFISWDSCPLHSSAISKIITSLKSALHDLDQSVLVGIWLGSPHLVLVSHHEDSRWAQKLDWRKILEPPFEQVWFHCNPQTGRRIFGRQPIEFIGGISPQSDTRKHPIRAFRQSAQTLLIQARTEAVRALTSDSKTDLLIDLYCGTGELSLLLPADLEWIGIESSKEAAQFANALRTHNTAYIGSVEDRLKDPSFLNTIHRKRYSLYLNPPRSGMSDEAKAGITRLLTQQPADRIAYLSCSASSLSRDLPDLEKAGYRVETLQPFDFFPQTEHFEIFALLSHLRA